MLGEKIDVVAIAEALGITRQMVYRIKRGRTAREKLYHNHYNGHAFNKNCPFCLEEQPKV